MIRVTLCENAAEALYIVNSSTRLSLDKNCDREVQLRIIIIIIIISQIRQLG